MTLTFTSKARCLQECWLLFHVKICLNDLVEKKEFYYIHERPLKVPYRTG